MTAKLWLGYFAMVACSHVFVLYDDVQFDKHGWRNRNRLLARPQPLWITAPVLTSGRHGQQVRDTRLAEGLWQQKHLKTIRQIYGKAPHFEWVFVALEIYLTARKYERLLDLCYDGHFVLAGLFGIKTPVRLASELGVPGGAADPTTRLVNICKRLGATRYIAASASRAYMNEALWRNAEIELHYQDYQHPTYEQTGNGFISHLSAVDALMFEGRTAQRLIGPPDEASGSTRAELGRDYG